MIEKTYIVATVKPWNTAAFNRYAPSLPGNWVLVDQRDRLTAEALAGIKPRYIFFPHWSWPVPSEILEAAECVCFHMTDVPYGRGGSPLQNLIVRGHQQTKITALRMTGEMDAGPVYAKRDLSLDGRAQDIFEKAAETIFQMIADIAAAEPAPVPQEGEVTVFNRRTPDQSQIPEAADLKQTYDHIRMLDAETYPQAFVDHDGLRFTFSDASLHDGEIQAMVTIKLKGTD